MAALTTLTLNSQGQSVFDLHARLQQLGEDIPADELSAQKFGPGTQAALEAAQKSLAVPSTGVLDATTDAALTQALFIKNTPLRSVSGTIVYDQGALATGLTVVVYNVGFADAAARLGNAVTDAAGRYTLPYRAAGVVNIEVRALPAGQKEGGTETTLSAPTFNAGPALVLNLVAPSSLHATTAEFDRLSADLAKQVGSIDKLAGAQENGARQDLTLLRQVSGWDARIVALAASAAQVSATTALPAAAAYALVRVGLPTDPIRLAFVGAEGVGAALQRASSAGIVSLSADDQSKAVQAYNTYVAATLPKLTAPGMTSSYGDLMKAAGLTTDEQTTLQRLYFTTDRNDDAQLWKDAAAAGIPAAKISVLQMQGKLAFLTFNSAALSTSLAAELGTAGLAKLVSLKLYDADSWKTRVTAAAGTAQGALAAAIPPAYVADSVDDRLTAYASDLARKVRRAFPTQTVSTMITNDELNLGAAHAQLKTPVTTFLNTASGLGFELGRQPLPAFIAKNHAALFNGVSAGDEATTTAAVKQLQRLYQIAPSNDAMKVLYANQLTSANDVARFERDHFLERYGAQFPSPGEALLTWRKAQQVSAVSYNFFTGAKQLDSGTNVYAVSPSSPTARAAAKSSIVENFPTMASLFGSLDFCECQDCRSVLSPAAYLVDLLQFLDPAAVTWQDFLSGWSTTHAGQSYTAKYLKPYDALVARRPDLPQLPLTCENTNTELPYIDVVNEVLEYYVSKGALAADAVHDTGTAQSEDLIAEPQNIIPDAYDKLKAAHYPQGLPFDLWIETVRRFFDHFDTSLAAVLEAFRSSDELLVPAATYDRAATFIESLEIAPVERALFNGATPLASWFELYGYADEPSALAALSSAETLADRLGLSYQDLINVVGSAFVNPKLATLIFLNKLGVSLDDVFRYKGQAGWPAFSAAETQAFTDKLTALSATYAPFNAASWLDSTWTAGGFNGSVVLADADLAGCDFSTTTLRYVEGTAVDPLALLRIALFTRLWRKLGWTLEETDRALTMFIPTGSNPLTAANLGAALDTALVYCAHLQSLAQTLNATRLSLLTLWGPLSTTGSDSLYAQLFLTPSILANDAVFDDPLGNYLSQPGLLLNDHLLAVQGALNLSANDVTAIVTDAGQTLATAPLSLANVSLLYRHGLLAKALQLSVPDLITLQTLSGLDPFAALDAEPLSTIARDQPFSSTIAFVTLAGNIGASGLAIADLDYLARQNIDPVGVYRDDPNALITFVLALASGLRQIASDNAVPSDPAALTDDLLREKLSLVLSADVVETFLAMLAGTVQYEAEVLGIAPAAALVPSALASESALTPSYDTVRAAQDLTYRGVLIASEKTRLETAYPGALLSQLLDAIDGQAHAFFDKYLAAFLQPTDFDLLFTPIPPSATDAASQAATVAKRTRLAQAFLPYLQTQLANRLVIETVTAAEGSDPTLTETLLGQAALLHDPASAATPLVTRLGAAGDSGVTATFYASTDGGGAALATSTVSTADGSSRPAGTNSASFDGYLVVPAAGAYRFYARLDKQLATVVLQVGDGPSPVLFGTAASDGAELSDFIELKAAVPYAFHFRAGTLGGGNVSLLVQSQSLPKDVLGQLTLYPAASVETVRRARLLFDKTLLLAGKLGLDESELSYLLSNGADFGGLDLSQLPTAPGIALAAARSNFTRLTRLCDYAALKSQLNIDGDDLVTLFANARRTWPAGTATATAAATVTSDVTTRLANLLRRDPTVVQAAATVLGYTATATASATDVQVVMSGLYDERGLARLWQVLQIVQQMGVPVTAVPGWTRIVGAAITPADAFAIARDVKHTVKALYTVEQWRGVAQPIFDKLRAKQRDALVAYCLDKLGLGDVNQLFEYFLIDPGMEPVVLTSRLVLATASVQTFIQRCLLNLESTVPAAAINAEYWEWMSRYRVWQANREIFLFPENWLEPEFRDDKSYLFTELQAALLQGDVTNDLVEDAFFKYLAELDLIARLDVVAMYCEELPLDPASSILHVVGRTHATPHKYFYRTCANEVWTAWVPITAEIESDHVVIAKWHDRMQLLWVTWVSKTQQDASQSGKTFTAAANDTIGSKLNLEVSAQLHWSELFQGSWTGRRTSGFTDPKSVGANFDPSTVYVHVSKSYNDDGSEDGLFVNLSGPLLMSFEVVSKNGDPEIASWTFPLLPPYNVDALTVDASRFVTSGPLVVTYVEQIEIINGGQPSYTNVSDDILQQGGSYKLLMGSMAFDFLKDDPTLSALASPFFYNDRQWTFFVEPTLTETRFELWQGWVIAPHYPPINKGTLGQINVAASIPATVRAPWPLPDPGDPASIDIDPLARFAPVAATVDWVTNPSTVVSYGGGLVGAAGGISARVSSLPGLAGATQLPQAGQSVLTVGAADVGNAAVLNVVGSAGVTPSLTRSLAANGVSDNQPLLGAGVLGARSQGVA